jgi:hypothetical protein
VRIVERAFRSARVLLWAAYELTRPGEKTMSDICIMRSSTEKIPLKDVTIMTPQTLFPIPTLVAGVYVAKIFYPRIANWDVSRQQLSHFSRHLKRLSPSRKIHESLQHIIRFGCGGWADKLTLQTPTRCGLLPWSH